VKYWDIWKHDFKVFDFTWSSLSLKIRMRDCTQVLEQLLRFNRFSTLSQTEDHLKGLHYLLDIEVKKKDYVVVPSSRCVILSSWTYEIT